MICSVQNQVQSEAFFFFKLLNEYSQHLDAVGSLSFFESLINLPSNKLKYLIEVQHLIPNWSDRTLCRITATGAVFVKLCVR